MATQYIGSRYVPLLADPPEWTSTRAYEALTIVLHQGNSYTSRQPVPTGIDIMNTDYWLCTGNYNAQVEQYRQEVRAYDVRIQEAEVNAETAVETAEDVADNLTTEIQNRESADTNLAGSIAALSSSVSDQFDGVADSIEAVNTNIGLLDDKIDDEIEARQAAITQLQQEIADSASVDFKAYNGHRLVIFGDSWVAPNIPNSVNGYIGNTLATTLGMTQSNFAAAGAGWGRAGNLVSTQVTSASDQLTADEKADTRLVIGLAGLNDYGNNVTASAVIQAIRQFSTSCASMFPNAKIMIVPMNWGYNGLDVVARKYIDDVMRGLQVGMEAGSVIIPGAWSWLLGFHHLFQNSAHPNSAGYDVIIRQLLNVLGGAPIISTLYSETLDVQTLGTGFSAGTVTLSLDGELVTVNGYARKAGDADSVITLLGEGVRPMFAPQERIIAFLFNSNRIGFSYLDIETNGRMQVHFRPEYVGGDTLWINLTYRVGCAGVTF